MFGGGRLRYIGLYVPVLNPLRGFCFALPVPPGRRGTFFCVAKRKYPKKRRPGAARNPAQKHSPQAPPNSPRANVTRLKQIGVLKPGGCTFVRLAPTGCWRFTHMLPSSTAQPLETAHSLQAKRAG